MIPEIKKMFHEPSASLLLALLICTDFVFFILHSLNRFLYWDNLMLSLGTDRGYSEIFQYIEWLWIVFLLVNLSLKNKSFIYSVWAIFFTYLLLDDAIQVHETGGAFISKYLSIISYGGFRGQDIGELIVTGAAGSALLSLVLLAYIFGSKSFRKMSHDMLLLIAALVFCGVVVDMIHTSLSLGKVVKMILGFIEDGGEMIVVSIISWYVFLKNIQDESKNTNIVEFVISSVQKLKS